MEECVGLCTAGVSPALLNFAVDAKGKVKGAGETPAVRKELWLRRAGPHSGTACRAPTEETTRRLGLLQRANYRGRELSGRGSAAHIAG